jgi:predicted outer membrane repeat protein
MHFSDVSFIDNSAVSDGGALANFGGNVTLSNVFFLRNTASSGGAMSNQPVRVWTQGPVIDGATFMDNTAINGGALYAEGGHGAFTVQVTNSTFWKNVGTNGGAIGLQALNGYSASIALRNVTVNADQGSTTGGGIWIQGTNGIPASATVSDSILWGDSAPSGAEITVGALATVTIDHSVVQGGCPSGATCSTLLATDPLLGLLQYNGGFTPTLMPAANSPALNVGVSCTTVDQRGVTRPQGAACDIGAVERRAVEDYLFNSGFEF